MSLIRYTMIVYRAALGNAHIMKKYDQATYRGEFEKPVRRAPALPNSTDVFDSVFAECKPKYPQSSLHNREMILYDQHQVQLFVPRAFNIITVAVTLRTVSRNTGVSGIYYHLPPFFGKTEMQVDHLGGGRSTVDIANTAAASG